MSTQLQPLPTVREQLEEARARLELAQVNATLRALPSSVTGLREGWGDLIDPMEWMRDEPGFGFAGIRGGPYFGPGGREHGQDLWQVVDDNDLRNKRAICRVIAETPAGRGALKNLMNFVIGTGFTYLAQAKPGRELPTGLLEEVQAIVDEFQEINRWTGGLERELFKRDVRDGEFFLGLWAGGDGTALARAIEPECVQAPTDTRGLEDALGIDGYVSDWAFGVHTDADDVEQAMGYYVSWNPTGTDWDYLDAQVVEHSKRNTDRNVKRGLSDFWYVHEDLQTARKLLRNASISAAAQAAIAWIREHAAGVTSTQVTNLQSSTATATRTTTTASGTQTRYLVDRQPGTSLDVPKGQEYKQAPLMGDGAAGGVVEIHQAVLRMVGANWCMPEYMVSGDASSGTYSNTMVAESPFVKNCEFEQSVYKTRFAGIFWKVLDIAIHSGRLQQCGIDCVKTLRRLVEIKVEAPRVASRNRNEDTNRNKILKEEGLLSPQTWATLEDLDYEEEQENRAQYEADHPQPTPPPVTEARLRAQKAAVSAALESARTTAEAQAILEQAFAEYP